MALATQQLKNVMRSPVVTVESAATAAEATRLARKSQVHHLPVMEDGILVGMICSCDLLETGEATEVRAAMSAPAISMRMDDTTLSAAERIKHQGIGAVIVVDELGAPCGIVTRADLLQPESGVSEVLADCRCACCGLTRHLRTDGYGQTLCVYCHERATDGSWLDIGEGD